MIGTRAIGAAMLLQLTITRRSPTQLMTLLTTPLFSAIYLSVVLSAGRPDLVVNALVAPGLTGIWFLAVQVGAAVVDDERWEGRLELLMTSRTPLAVVVFARILLVVLIGLVTFVESWAVARFGFGVDTEVRHWWLFGGAALATCFAAACTATAMSAAFVLSRSLHIFQNSLTYPAFLLGGVFVPLSVLPSWLGPLGDGVFLSWSADLLRDAVTRAEVAQWPSRMVVLLALGAVALLAGVGLTSLVVARARVTASAGRA
ncbi:hypothetical protein SUDANB95_04886 [Actinosynnema sp. ALI-1.44]